MRLDKKDLSKQVVIGFKNTPHYTVLWLLKILPTGQYLIVQSKVAKLEEKFDYEMAFEKSIEVLEVEYKKKLEK